MKEVGGLGETRRRLESIEPYQFEFFIADLWERQGWDTEVSQESNDMGVDIEAKKSNGLIDQELAIQVKRYSNGNNIGRPQIQQYLSLKQQNASTDAVIVVTTSGFTRTAEEYADEHNVKLVDGEALAELVGGSHLDLLDEYAPMKTAPEGSEDEDGEMESNREDLESTELPEPLADEGQRKIISVAAGGAGILTMAGIIDLGTYGGEIGLLITILSIIVYTSPEQFWAVITGSAEFFESLQDDAEELRHEILETLDDSGLDLTPEAIAHNINFDEGQVKNQCRELESEGLVDQEDASSDRYYSISDEGRKRLSEMRS